MVLTNSSGSLHPPDHNNHSIQSVPDSKKRPTHSIQAAAAHLITQTNALHPNPRQPLLKGRQSYIQYFQGPTHDIFLMWDPCSTLQDPDIQTFMGACQLYNLQSRCTSGIPINTSARGRHIDFLFGTTLLQISMHKSGILNFNNSQQSDHRALFADFDELTVFQGSTTDPTAPS